MDSLFSGFFSPLWLINNFFTLWGTGSNGYIVGVGSQTFGSKGTSKPKTTTTTVVPKPAPATNPTVAPPLTNSNTIGGSSGVKKNTTIALPTVKTNVVTDVDIVQTNVGKEQQMYMRAKTIQFTAEGLKPNTRYYAFFNDVDVSNNTSSVSGQKTSVLVTNAIGKLVGNFYLPAQTFVSGTAIFRLVDTVVSDANGNNIPGEGYTGAEADYHSTGILKNFQTNITTKSVTTLSSSTVSVSSTVESDSGVKPLPEPTPKTGPTTNPNPGNCPKPVPPQINVWQRTVTTKVQQTNAKGQPVYTNQFGAATTANLSYNFNGKGSSTPAMTTKTTTETRKLPASAPAPAKSANTSTTTYSAWTLKQGPIADPSYKPPTAGVGVDPIAQSFRVDPSIFPNGLYITQIVTYFKTVDRSAPVTLELRNMINGMPGPSMLPGAKVVVPGPAVGASSNASVGTTFVFNQPVYLVSGEEYCFVLKSPSLGYELWCSRFGTPDIITNTLITDQPFSGILFKSANDSTWTPDQYEDVKFEMYAAQFDTNVTSNMIFRPHRRKLLPTQLINGRQYTIGSVGGTNWTGIGSASNTAELLFTYNGNTPSTTGTDPGYAYDVYYNTGQVVLYSDLTTTSGSGVVNVQTTTHGLITGDKVVMEELPYTSEFTGSISGTVLTVTKFNYGDINVGDYITGSGVTAGTKVLSLGTGTGGLGTYNLDTSQSVSSRALVASKDVINGIVTGNLVGEFTVTRVDEDNFTITAKNSDTADISGKVVVSDFLPLLDTAPPTVMRQFQYDADTLTTENPVANSPSTSPSLANQDLDYPNPPINVAGYSFRLYSNVKVNEIMIDYLGTEVEQTDIKEYVKLATATSTEGSEVPYEETPYVEVDKDGVFHSFDEPRVIATPLNENTHNVTLNGPSALVRLNMTSTDTNVSPVVDTTAMSLIIKTYVIDNQNGELDGLTTENDYNNATLNSEINPGTGNAASKYKTRTLDLAESYKSLSVYVNANCPSPTIIDCYVRTSNDSTTHMDEDWVWVPLEGVFGTEFVNSPDKDTINEYFYYHEAADKFTVYDMKFVMRSTNNSIVPKIYSIRSMANFE